MDAVEFLREYRRMCEKYRYSEGCVEGCSEKCPLNGCYCDLGYRYTDIESTVSKVEQWSKSHPQKTMMQDFFEKFPNAPKTMLGYPYPCAKDLGYPKLDSCSFGVKGGAGSDCKECWSRPLEE